MNVYLVQNKALMPTSSYYATMAVYSTLEAAKCYIEEMRLYLVSAIDNCQHEGFFPSEYKIAFNRDVPEEYDEADYQMCFYDDSGYYDIYWIEEAEVDGEKCMINN